MTRLFLMIPIWLQFLFEIFFSVRFKHREKVIFNNSCCKFCWDCWSSSDMGVIIITVLDENFGWRIRLLCSKPIWFWSSWWLRSLWKTSQGWSLGFLFWFICWRSKYSPLLWQGFSACWQSLPPSPQEERCIHLCKINLWFRILYLFLISWAMRYWWRHRLLSWTSKRRSSGVKSRTLFLK